MQKTLFLLLIIWNSSTLASGKSICHLHFSLGSQVVIPCQHMRSVSGSFKWLHKTDEHSKESRIFLQDKKGMRYHDTVKQGLRVSYNRSLIINSLKEDYQGLYWCENCYQDNCKSEQTTIITVKKEILDEIKETINVTAGSSFTHACPGEFTNLEWTFEVSDTTALRILTERSKTDFVTSNKSIHIVNVKRADTGKYTCWTRRCDGNRQKLLTINLCVITGNGTHAPSYSSNKTTGTLTEPEYLMPVICGTSAALASLILMPFLIFCFRQRLQADHCSGFGIEGRGEKFSVVYSSLVIRRPAQRTDIHMTQNDCVYSEITSREKV